jgi:hypothetical protein
VPPPRFMPTVFLTPCLESHCEISKLLTVVAPVRLAIFAASEMWSAWPCVMRMKSAFTSPDFTGAVGESSRNGSTMRWWLPVAMEKQEWPSQVISDIDSGVRTQGVRSRDNFAIEHLLYCGCQ